MKYHIALPFLFLALFMPAFAFSASQTVAVMNFTNHAGRGLQYLSSSLPESVSASLAENRDLRVVERAQLGRLLDEIALEQSGVIASGNVSRAGQIARADVLIIGSVSGNPKQLVVIMKAVRVTDGQVITARTVQAPMSEIFDQVAEASQSMAAILSGKGVGLVSVSSTPDGASVYIDGMMVGKTPLIEHKTTIGTHRLKVVKSGYIDYEQKISVKQNDTISLSPYLRKDELLDRSYFSFGISYFHPLPEEMQSHALYAISWGQNFGQAIIGADLGLSLFTHNEEIDDYFGTIEKDYDMIYFHGNIQYIPFRSLQNVSPYFGGILGYTHLVDMRDNALEDNEREHVRSHNLLALGGTVGMNIIPFSRFSLFIEGRYVHHFPKIRRDTHEAQGYFLADRSEKILFNYFTLGGGVKYYY